MSPSENKKTQILITGPLPPPAGGISIHIHRLSYLLHEDFNFDFIDESSNIKKKYFNIRSLNLIRYFKLIRKSEILFIHSGNRFFKKLHVITGKLFQKKIIMTIHGYGLKRKFPFSKIDSFIYSLPDKIILVNEDIHTRIKLPKEKCVIKHAFLPPIIEEEPVLPEIITERINSSRSKKEVIIAANASRLNTHDNQDLYGLDQCVELSKRLIDKNIKASFIFIVSSIDQGIDRFNAAADFIATHKLENNFLLINANISFVRLIEQCDIVLRSTNTDGDALTIREGLHFEKLVLASDIVERPKGTFLFKTRDIADLENKILDLIKLINQEGNIQSKNKPNKKSNYHDFYKDIILSTMHD